MIVSGCELCNLRSHSLICHSISHPQVINSKGHTKSVDLWSVGVVLHILLVGYPPFQVRVSALAMTRCAAQLTESTTQLRNLIPRSKSVRLAQIDSCNDLKMKAIAWQYGLDLFSYEGRCASSSTCLLRHALTHPLATHMAGWESISIQAKHLVTQLLALDPAKRITAAAALKCAQPPMMHSRLCSPSFVFARDSCLAMHALFGPAFTQALAPTLTGTRG